MSDDAQDKTMEVDQNQTRNRLDLALLIKTNDRMFAFESELAEMKLLRSRLAGATGVVTAITAIVLAVCCWVLSSVLDLKTHGAVLDQKISSTSEKTISDIERSGADNKHQFEKLNQTIVSQDQRWREDFKRLEDKFGPAVDQLKASVIKLDTLSTQPAKPSQSAITPVKTPKKP